MDDVEVGLRREAARRRLAGESPGAIATDLGLTRQWVAKWAARYDPHDPGKKRSLHVKARLVSPRPARATWSLAALPTGADAASTLGAATPPRRASRRA